MGDAGSALQHPPQPTAGAQHPRVPLALGDNVDILVA